MGLIRRVIAGRLDGLADPQARRVLVIEIFRQLPVLDFEGTSEIQRMLIGRAVTGLDVR
jgi:hypothetical protein